MKNACPLFSKLVIAVAVFTLAGAHSIAQVPALVQVPYIGVGAGIISGGASSQTVPSSCTTALKTTGGGSYGDGCPANEAAVSYPWGAATDSWGNVYFGDDLSSSSATGYLRVIYAGPTTVNGVANPATAMILAANATQTTLTSLVTGNVYALAGGPLAAIAESGSTYYCNGSSGATALNSAGNGCPATQGYIKANYGAAVDSAGNVFVVDKGNSVVFVVIANATSLAAKLVTLENPSITTPQVGYIYQIVGDGGGYVDGVLASPTGKIHAPYGIAVDANDNLYISDYTNDAVRMINGPNTTAGSYGPGFIHTIAGNCTSSACTALATGPASGTAALGAALDLPSGIAVDGSGNVYIGDNGDASPTNVPSTVRVIYAGGTNNPLASLICLEISSTCSGTLVAGDIYTIAGGGTNVSNSAGTGNGALATSTAVEFARIVGLALDSHGNVYIGDYNSHTVISELNAQTGYLVYLAGAGQTTFANGDFCSGSTIATGTKMTDNYGDGCPGPQSNTNHVEGNIAVDSSGNMYFADNGDNLLRELTYNSAKTSAGNFPSTAVGTADASQKLAFTLLTGSGSSQPATAVSVSVLTQGATSSEFANAGAGDTCTASSTLTGASSGATSNPNTICEVPIIFTPAKVGARTGAVQITATINSTTQVYGTAYLNGIGLGAAIALDPVSASILGSGTTPQGVATDASGNTYIDFAGTGTLTSTGGALAATAGTGLSSPYQIAVDGAGNVFVADSGNNRIAEFPSGTSTATTVAVTGLSKPQGVALDAAGNMYIADTGNHRVLFQANGNGELMTLGSGFTTPVAVAVDADNNVYVADSGLGAIVEIAASTGTQTTLLSGINPAGVAVDAAGDVYYTDSTAKSVAEIPVSGANATIVSGLITPAGIALNASGSLYVADTSNTGVSYYIRTSSNQSFASISTILSANLTNVGNQSYTETGNTFTQTDATDFNVAASASNGCNFAAVLAAGADCSITAQFTPQANGALSDTVTFSGNATNAGSVILSLSGSGSVTVSTTTTLSAVSPVSPTYGQTVSITATVTPVSGSTAPAGNITFTVDGVAQSPVALSGGAYTLSLTSPSAGQHTVSATYAGGGNFSGSSTTTGTSFTVASLAITATATTNTTTAVYGQAIPAITGTLNGVLSADTANVSPIFAVTAVQGSPVASYPVSVSLTGSAAANYTVTLTGTPALSITPATVTLVVANATKVYGAALPSFTGTFTGLLAADQNNVAGVYSTIATASSSVNTYPITATGLSGSAAGNYTLGTVTPGILTVTAAPLTTTATTPVDVTYGSAIPTLTGSALAGVLPADQGNVTAVFSTTATSTSPVATYPISVALSGSAAANYTVSLTTPAVVTIQQATVTVAVNSASTQYGAALPSFSGVLTGVLSQDAASVGATYSTTATSTSAPKTYPITATALTGSASSNYKLGTVTAGTLTVSKATTNTALTASVASVDEGTGVTFTATVTSTTTGTPTGSVTFYSGTTSIGTGTLSSGVATVNTATLAYGTQSITAVYGGSVDYNTSTSSPYSESVIIPIVAPTLSASSLTISSSGGSGTVTLNIAAQGGYTGTATYSCVQLPVDMTCSFAPPSSTFTTTATTATTVLTISTKGTTTALLHTPALPGSHHNLPLLALCFPGVLLGFLGLRNRKYRYGWQRLMMFAILIAGLAGLAGITGCGTSGGASNSTPAGTYNIQVQVTAGTVQTAPLTVIVQ
jgi:streptogramin lyase